MADNAFDMPSNSQIAQEDGTPTAPWMQLFTRLVTAVNASGSSGTTANRPTSGLWVGRRYFDTTLGYPVYLKSVRPNVWVNGAGAVV
jgi:hypothetical protein